MRPASQPHDDTDDMPLVEMKRRTPLPPIGQTEDHDEDSDSDANTETLTITAGIEESCPSFYLYKYLIHKKLKLCSSGTIFEKELQEGSLLLLIFKQNVYKNNVSE